MYIKIYCYAFILNFNKTNKNIEQTFIIYLFIIFYLFIITYLFYPHLVKKTLLDRSLEVHDAEDHGKKGEEGGNEGEREPGITKLTTE